jgi:hypothetical protein
LSKPYCLVLTGDHVVTGSTLPLLSPHHYWIDLSPCLIVRMLLPLLATFHCWIIAWLGPCPYPSRFSLSLSLARWAGLLPLEAPPLLDGPEPLLVGHAPTGRQLPTCLASCSMGRIDSLVGGHSFVGWTWTLGWPMPIPMLMPLPLPLPLPLLDGPD